MCVWGREEEEAMKAWFQRTPIMRKRARLLEEEAEAQGLKGKAAKKGEAKKPKGKKGKKKKKKWSESKSTYREHFSLFPFLYLYFLYCLEHFVKKYLIMLVYSDFTL